MLTYPQVLANGGTAADKQSSPDTIFTDAPDPEKGGDASLAARNFLQQQARFDEFIAYFNHQRPHQALGMKYPAELYKPSPRPYTGLTELDYPFHDKTITITQCGRICIGRRKINLSTVFAGQNLGVKQIADQIWLVSFMDYDLGFFDNETGRVECAQNPFNAKVLPMSPTVRVKIVVAPCVRVPG